MFKERTGRAVGERVRMHVRTHVIGYVALFVALSGVAYANDGPLAGQNSVGSADIIDEEVYTQDIQLGAIGTLRVANDSLTKDDLAPGSAGYTELDPNAFTFANDIAGSCNLFCSYGVKNNAIQSNEILDGTVNSADLQDGQVKSADIQDATVTRSDLAANAKPVGFQTTGGNTGIICNNFCTEGTLPLPKGIFAISAKITVVQQTGQGDLLHVVCNLGAEGVQDTSFARVVGDDVFEAGSAAGTTLPLETLHTFTSPGSVTVDCRDFDIGDADGEHLKIVAVQVG